MNSMSILFLIVLAMVLLSMGYRFYGLALGKWLNLKNDTETPACQFQNNIDFVPTNKFYLLGQHLSAIAAAGPIVGPILAGMWFGWLPTFLWIILGGILIGGVHDFTALVASIRHQGKSIAEVVRVHMSRRAFILFLLFLWFSIIYIITAFTDITAGTFVEPMYGPAVASSSMMYLGLAVVMGVALRLFRTTLFLSTLIFLPMVFVCVVLGPVFPLKLSPVLGMDLRTTWDVALLSYCFFAAVIPVWLLLQPRGYLGGFVLTLTAGLSFIGVIAGSLLTKTLVIRYPAFTGWVNPQGLPLLPLLFTTVACGACSGFHAIVSSGTTSKQIAKETDAKLVGYGGMLLESFVAIMALATLLVLRPQETTKLSDPNMIYARGIAAFLGGIGIDEKFALNFALLAFATFVYDTLDVATRLGRYIFEELTGWRNKFSPHLAALATLALPVVFVTRKIVDAQGKTVPAWKFFWTIFGSSNQLLAAMVLLGVSVWLFRSRRKFLAALLPALFMLTVAVISLVLVLRPSLENLFARQQLFPDPVLITGIALLLLAFLLVVEALRIFFGNKREARS